MLAPLDEASGLHQHGQEYPIKLVNMTGYSEASSCDHNKHREDEHPRTTCGFIRFMATFNKYFPESMTCRLELYPLTPSRNSHEQKLVQC